MHVHKAAVLSDLSQERHNLSIKSKKYSELKHEDSTLSFELDLLVILMTIYATTTAKGNTRN